MRFFPSLKFDDILAMTPQKTKYYLEAMKIIRARERLELMDAVIYPKIKDEERRKKHRDLYRTAYPEKFSSRVLKTTDLELF